MITLNAKNVSEFMGALVLQGGGSAAKVRTKLPQVNGVAHPKEGTRCAQVWAWCDQQRNAGVHPTVKGARAALPTLDPTTVQVQYYRYRKYHAYSTPVAAPVAAPAEQVAQG
jgi:hypothetical protein